MNSKATEDQFAALHNAVTTELANRVSLGAEASTADIKAAIDWLHKNNITGVASSHSPLEGLLESLELNYEDVERAISQ